MIFASLCTCDFSLRGRLLRSYFVLPSSEPCRASKLKCDRKRPCSGCEIRGTTDQCYPDDTAAGSIDDIAMSVPPMSSGGIHRSYAHLGRRSKSEMRSNVCNYHCARLKQLFRGKAVSFLLLSEAVIMDGMQVPTTRPTVLRQGGNGSPSPIGYDSQRNT